MASRIAACLLVLLSWQVAPALAQTPGDAGPDPSTVRLRIGPLSVSPKFELANLGVDTNVFNEPTDLEPKKDFTLTAAPSADVWLRLGRSWLQANVREDLVWYRRYASERSANSRYDLTWRLPLNRLRIDLNPSYRKTHERPGFEIDARSERIEKGAKGAIEVRGFAKTFLGVTGGWQKVDFDSVATFEGVNLRQALNRTVATGGLSVRHQLTPLTSIGFVAAREEERFEFSPLRDSNSTTYTGTVTFDPAALIKGSASFGYRDFQPIVPGLPSFQGGTASVDLAYTMLGMTRFSVQARRDVQYSFEINQPYYLETGFGGSITQQVFGPFDVQAKAGSSRLAYRNRQGVAITASNRVDHVRNYGGGLGYHLGRDMRIGFNVEQWNRTSDVSFREYEALRYGTSVTYGF